MSEIKIVRDDQENTVVVIPNIIFWNKQNIDWQEIKKYLKRYVGEIIENIETNEKIMIGNKFTDEYVGSKDSHYVKGARAKAKANAVQGIKEIVKTASNKVYKENQKSKHDKDAEGGWYYYTVRFALPIYDNGRKTEMYSVFKGRMVVNCSHNGNLYLYDIVDIKKEASTPLRIHK